MALKHILINWNWNTTFDPEKPWKCTGHTDESHKGDLYQLWCVNYKGKDWLEQLKSKLQSLLDKNDCLVLLHKNPPHSHKGSDVSSIHDFISGLNSTNKAYVRLFGGGTEPLYYGPKSPLGILGDRDAGIFGTYFVDVEGESFLLDLVKGVDVVAHENLAYIWKNYWEHPKKLVYNMIEDLRLYTDGFDVKSDTKWQDHLQKNVLLWSRLNCFADDKFFPEKKYAFTLDHKLSVYRIHLGAQNPLLSQLDQCSASVKALLTAEKPDISIKDTYNRLFDLYKAIPAKLEL